jgi:hypothetical protein
LTLQKYWPYGGKIQNCQNEKEVEMEMGRIAVTRTLKTEKTQGTNVLKARKLARAEVTSSP